jgi:hypothetical protein
MAYSYAAVFASEFISTLFAIYLGESIIANEVLAGTKGRAMVSLNTIQVFESGCMSKRNIKALDNIFLSINKFMITAGFSPLLLTAASPFFHFTLHRAGAL